MSKKDPRDIDEDAILKGLSAEELEQLECELQDMDPEVKNIQQQNYRSPSSPAKCFQPTQMLTLLHSLQKKKEKFV